MPFFRLLRFFHQSIIINRYQFIISADTALQFTPVHRLFQIRYNLIKCLSNCYVRIVIHTPVQLPVIHIINGVIISLRSFLNTDITVCQTEGKLCFFSAHCLAFGVYVRIFPLHERYIFHYLLLVSCRHEVFHFPLSVKCIKPVHIEGNIIKTAAL